MFIRFILFLLIICSACQSGIIPCPTVKSSRIKKSRPYRPSLASLTARSNEEVENIHNKAAKSDERTFKNITVEEWDCPRPGTKRYMPKTVKENIRKNMKKIKSAAKDKHEADSLFSPASLNTGR
jgi:hypothetical protein